MVDNETLNSIALGSGGTFGAVWVVRTMWRRIARDGAEVAKDRVEINILESLQNQMNAVLSENAALRKREAELERRTGQLEYREKEALDARELIQKMGEQLSARESMITSLIDEHARVMSEMTTKLQTRDNEIKNLRTRVAELERKLSAYENTKEKE